MITQHSRGEVSQVFVKSLSTWRVSDHGIRVIDWRIPKGSPESQRLRNVRVESVRQWFASDVLERHTEKLERFVGVNRGLP